MCDHYGFKFEYKDNNFHYQFLKKDNHLVTRYTDEKDFHILLPDNADNLCFMLKVYPLLKTVCVGKHKRFFLQNEN